MKHIIYFSILFLSITKSYGAEGVITCSTPQERHIIKISEEQVTLIDQSSEQKRSVASNKKEIRTKLIGHGVTKIMLQDGNKHTIHISDLKSFNRVEDYLSIRSNKGHTMTYPLDCSRSI